MIGYPYIGSIGLELECGIPSSKRTAFERWAHQKYGDRFEPSGDPTAGGGGEGYVQGREYLLHSTSMPDLLDFVDKAYNTYGVKANSHCGFHIHMKPNTRKLSYDLVKASIAHKAFQEEFIDKFRAEYAGKPKYLNRLVSTYSRWNYNTENVRGQLMRGGNRYTPINLLSTTEPQGTIEFRLMPNQESGAEAQRTLKWMGKTVNGMFKEMDNDSRLVEEGRITLKRDRTDFTPDELEQMERRGIRVRTA
jgi:hypothetical protein